MQALASPLSATQLQLLLAFIMGGRHKVHNDRVGLPFAFFLPIPVISQGQRGNACLIKGMKLQEAYDFTVLGD